MSKKIIIVANNAWYAYNFRLNLARALKSFSFDVSFIIPFDEKYTTFLKKEFHVDDIFIDPKGINPKNDFRTIKELYKIFKKNKPNMVLNFTIKPNIYSSLVCGILGIPCISNITGLGTIFIKESLVTKIAKLLYKKALSYNSKVFFQNTDDQNLFISLKLVEKIKVDILPGSGVDLNKFRPIVKKEDDYFKFLMIARLLKDKGILELIEAIKILKTKKYNFDVHLLGEIGVQNNTAVKQEELDEWVADKLVVYLGKTDNVEDVISTVDCVVLPSYREGTPRSLLEACAMKKPIIATNAVGCKKVVDDNINGFLCEVRNPIDLARKMENMINLSFEDRLKMGSLGREKMEKQFDERIVINKYISSIKEIL